MPPSCRVAAPARVARRAERVLWPAQRKFFRVIVGQGSFSKENHGKRVARARRDLVHIGLAATRPADVHEITTCTRYAREHLKMHRNTLL